MGAELHDIVIGLASTTIAGVVVCIIGIIRKRKRNADALHKYPVNGVYASSYTDETDGGQCIVRDEVHIEQHGLKFTGFSRELENRRTFRFEGQIVNERFLTGTYGGEHRADDASGVFFMVLDRLQPGLIQGLWAGFGAGTIVAGKWNWRKLDSVSISESLSDDPSRPLATSLLNDALGSGFVTTRGLDELSSSPDGVVLLARDSRNQLVGVATAMTMNDDSKRVLESKLAEVGVRGANIVRSRVGLFKSLAVIPAAQGKGIGLNLVYEGLGHLKDFGCSTALVLAWDSGTSQSSVGVFEAAGCVRIAELPEYWREPDRQETFDCIKCGRPCACTAIVMRRSLYNLTRHDEIDDRPRKLWFRSS